MDEIRQPEYDKGGDDGEAYIRRFEHFLIAGRLVGSVYVKCVLLFKLVVTFCSFVDDDVGKRQHQRRESDQRSRYDRQRGLRGAKMKQHATENDGRHPRAKNRHQNMRGFNVSMREWTSNQHHAFQRQQEQSQKHGDQETTVDYHFFLRVRNEVGDDDGSVEENMNNEKIQKQLVRSFPSKLPVG